MHLQFYFWFKNYPLPLSWPCNYQYKVFAKKLDKHELFKFAFQPFKGFKEPRIQICFTLYYTTLIHLINSIRLWSSLNHYVDQLWLYSLDIFITDDIITCIT